MSIHSGTSGSINPQAKVPTQENKGLRVTPWRAELPAILHSLDLVVPCGAEAIRIRWLMSGTFDG